MRNSDWEYNTLPMYLHIGELIIKEGDPGDEMYMVNRYSNGDGGGESSASDV